MIALRSRTLLATTLLSGLLSVTARPASAVELLYTWKAGEIHRFRLEEHTRIQLAGMATGAVPGMPGMPGGAVGVPGTDMTAHVNSTFSEKVLKVRPDGTAEIELSVEDLQVAQGDGKPVSALGALPPAARKVKAEVDRKGHARFYKIITVYQIENRFVVGGYASTGRNGVAAGASATTPDGQKIEVYGSIDARTGKVTAGAKASTVDPVTKKAVQVKAEDPGIEVVPRQIFELMVLPDGDMAPGSSVELANPLGKVRVTCDPIEGTVAPVRFATVAAAATPPTGGSANAPRPMPGPAGEGDSEGHADPGGMPMLGGMPMPGAGAAMPQGGGGVSTAMRLTVDVRSRFDVAAGRLLEVRGRMGTAMGGGDGSGLGAGVKIDTDLVLSRVPSR